jgi:hypothetical protein
MYRVMQPKFWKVVILSLLICAAASARESGNPAVQILSASPNGLTLEFSARGWRLDAIPAAGQDFALISFEGATVIDEPGLPQIPYHTAVIGMPVGASVRYQIIEADYEILEPFKLVPHPTLKNVDDEVLWDIEPNAQVYASAEPFPAQLVSVDPPAFFRDQQIVRLQVAGARFLPNQQQIWKYNRIALQIEFVGGRPRVQSAGGIASEAEERLYRGALLNYQQARDWRQSRPRSSKINQTSSVFEFGTLYKFNVQQEGIYKIDGAFLESQNINLSSIAPAKIRLFNNGGRELPTSLAQPRPQGLVENAIVVVDGGDGRFDRSDHILFYGVGVEGWEYNAASQRFSHYIHHHAAANVYWLSFDGQEDGLRMAQAASGQPSASIQETYQGLAFLEEELVNPVRSGLNFLGRQFAINEIDQRRTFTLDLPNAVASPAELQIRFVALNAGIHRFAISLNNISLGSRQFSGIAPLIQPYLILKSADFTVPVENALVAGANSLQLSYSHLTSGGQPSTSGQAFLDWFELFYTAQLRAVDNELAFTVSPQDAPQTYRIANFSGGVELYDVTNFARVQKIVNFELAGGSVTFTDSQPTGLPKRFLALTPAKYKTIQNLERTEVADLRNPLLAAEFIIITHEDFYSEAQRLESLRENGSPENRMQTEVVRVSDIFANFSGGLMDPTAIRDFIKHAYDNWNIRPAYVLLLGDGDFDPKNITSRSDKNWIPTFQTNDLSNSDRIEELGTRTSDSWFTYVSGNDAVMDLAIGRLTVQTLSEARSAVDKIIAYETQPQFGGWRNTITMVGDDELVNNGRPGFGDYVHILQTETIAEVDLPDYFDLEKIYLSEFPKVIGASVGGVRKPAAKEALIQQINKGTLIVNYIGHGNPTIWAHEAVFEQADNPRIQNPGRLAFFVAATCDWALFDNPERQSQAEELLLAENRGAIGVLTAARLVFSSSNFAFNRFFYRGLFDAGAVNPLGDAFLYTRLRTSNVSNDEKFHLFGDPTLRLGAPKYQAVITAMNPDSILALSTVEVSGEVQRDGQLWSDFNGKALINTFDSKKFVQHNTEVGVVQEYFLPGNAIYRGAVSVDNGRFTAKFIVPKDISYGGNRARVSAYVWNDQVDGGGFRDNILVSSTSSNLVDREGPHMRVYFAGRENFVSGDIINDNATLVVELADSVSGINITGEIGHGLTLTIDPDEETCLSQLNRFLGISSIELTDLFQFDEGSHLSGRVEFPLQFPETVNIAGREVECTPPGSSERRHKLVIKAWDNANNSSTTTVEVVVVASEELVLRDVLNYPNPFQQSTTFTFISNHDAEVTIKIYTVAGQLIQTIANQFARSGFNMIEWDGRDAAGDLPANGIYLYKLMARSLADSDSKPKEVVGKLAIVR